MVTIRLLPTQRQLEDVTSDLEVRLADSPECVFQVEQLPGRGQLQHPDRARHENATLPRNAARLLIICQE